jgi:hypothetical protein
MTHCTTHNIISASQYAFRPNSSTSLALQTILDKLRKHTSNRQPTLAIYLDLSKAYDTISHDKLLHKLRHTFNFDDNTITFLTSYFTNRTQATHTEHAHSEHQTTHTAYYRAAHSRLSFSSFTSTTSGLLLHMLISTPTLTTQHSSLLPLTLTLYKHMPNTTSHNSSPTSTLTISSQMLPRLPTPRSTHTTTHRLTFILMELHLSRNR